MTWPLRQRSSVATPPPPPSGGIAAAVPSAAGTEAGGADGPAETAGVPYKLTGIVCTDRHLASGSPRPFWAYTRHVVPLRGGEPGTGAEAKGKKAREADAGTERLSDAKAERPGPDDGGD